MPGPQSMEALLPAADRVVMISGANRGIGAAIAERLLADGYRLSLGMRRPTVPASPDRVLAHRFDAHDPATAQAWVEATVVHFGRLDALINNAGIFRVLTFDEGTEDDLDELFAVNVKAPFRLTRAALPHLRQSPHGRVVNIASTDGKRYRDPTASIGYVMSKHALVAMTHATRVIGWEDHLRATALCPGAVETDLVKSVPGVVPGPDRIRPETLAETVSLLLRLPDNASVAEMVVNTRCEAML